jgi:hypothetical protein
MYKQIIPLGRRSASLFGGEKISVGHRIITSIFSLGNKHIIKLTIILGLEQSNSITLD